MTRFRDATGRPGPAAWELGSYPEGRAEYPVSGHQLVRGRGVCRIHRQALPTIYHWHRRRGRRRVLLRRPSAQQLRRKGPIQCDERDGLGPWGTLDMAGNVKEWCLNRIGRHRCPLHPWRRVERTGLSLPRSRCGGSLAARRDLRDSAGEESRTAGDKPPRCPLHGDPRLARPARDQRSSVLKGLLRLRPGAAHSRRSRRSTTARETSATRRSASLPHTAANAFSRISSCRRTRGRRSRRCCTFRTPTPVRRIRATAWI